MSMTRGTIVIMAGGTGGHIFPGIAVAEALQEKGYKIEWLGANGLELKLVPQHGFPLHSLAIAGIRGNGLKGWLTLPWRLTKAVLDARRFFKRVAPLCVVGFGGFAAGPGGLAAKSLGIPIIIHEQNAVPGLVNRVLARLSRVNLAAFNAQLPKAKVVGNPVREGLLSLIPYQDRYRARSGKPLQILVVGGSQGARILNEVLSAFAKTEMAETYQIWHQTGKAFYQAHKDDPCFQGAHYRLTPFIDDMVEAYGWADLIICRAGALTVSEVLVANVASCFIPFARAVDDHQTKNAEALADIGAAYLYQECDFNLATLQEMLTHFTREQAIEMASKTEILAKPEATTEIVSVIEKVIKS
ncbi:undecaprenyldiphospho-muramoylpentapeptide beta-N-acetylglucosaminyltransferase [Ignatzschineria cameli]|uniref:undecaprenyldiphospho-muramoylpentapeptide beta-N-acetylglucosaminyltransferase n=1 Tax=Ignatzschineria cameli TaxID=2182793 RepID=UPI000D620088|nr:undecaprenyldiphospho-muramoylpentapeptide beta-N-acetylglucosaminyltransferase [Ignatzschineria cameli]PWD86535.1 undecaprenyldiphospho-muramoylpentapeptide beta-N-acetylglucosaminyltransferase [Ignatzschineria cameli]